MEEAIPRGDSPFSWENGNAPSLAHSLGVRGCWLLSRELAAITIHPIGLGGHNPKDFFSIRLLRVLYLESVCNFPLFPLKSPGSTGTGKRPLASPEAGELGVEVKLDGILFGPRVPHTSLRVCHRSEGDNFISAPNQHGLCDFKKKKTHNKSAK